MTPLARCLRAPFLVCFALFVACGNDEEPRDGYGPGAIGAYCRSPYDCPVDAYCCVTPPCGGGSCTYACRSDLDCPYGSLCEGGACFLACRTDADCYAGQRCKHDHTVCQY